MSGNGWVKIHRSLDDHWLWQRKPFSYGQAWIDILLQCNHSDSKVLIEGELLNCKRGQSLKSLKTWAQRWGWSIQKVRTYFTLLEKDKMIVTKGLRKTTLLTIVNYDIYQREQHGDNTEITQRQHRDNTEITTNKNEKKNKNEKNESSYSKESNKVNHTSKTRRGSLPKNGKPPKPKIPDPEILMKIYLEENIKLPAVIAFTEKRSQKCRKRMLANLGEIDTFLKYFRQAVKKAQYTPFLCGNNDRNWRASFDWFVANDENYVKVLEGNYDKEKV